MVAEKVCTLMKLNSLKCLWLMNLYKNIHCGVTGVLALVGCFGGDSNQCISSFRVAVPTDGVRDNRLTCGLSIYCVVPWNLSIMVTYGTSTFGLCRQVAALCLYRFSVAGTSCSDHDREMAALSRQVPPYKEVRPVGCRVSGSLSTSLTECEHLMARTM